jgi:hypothetical protein
VLPPGVGLGQPPLLIVRLLGGHAQGLLYRVVLNDVCICSMVIGVGVSMEMSINSKK